MAGGTRPPELARDDATPGTPEEVLSALPAVYLISPTQGTDRTPLDVQQVGQALLTWTRQWIAICLIVLTAGLVMIMLALSLMASLVRSAK